MHSVICTSRMEQKRRGRFRSRLQYAAPRQNISHPVAIQLLRITEEYDPHFENSPVSLVVRKLLVDHTTQKEPPSSAVPSDVQLQRSRYLFAVRSVAGYLDASTCFGVPEQGKGLSSK
jgi:hypothetical protein